MTTLIKLIDRLTGDTTWKYAPLGDYLTLEGIEYFEERSWRHVFVRIPYWLVRGDYKEQYICFAMITEQSTVGEISKYRSAFYNENLLITSSYGKQLYQGRATFCPEELHALPVSQMTFDNSVLSLEVAND